MANLDDEVALLRRIPLFAHIDTPKLKLLAFTSQRITFGDGQELFHQGDDADAAFVIVDGSADVLVDSGQGQISVARIEKNALVGEIAILCDVQRTATVRALTKLVTLRIMKEQFFTLLAEFPELSIEIMKVLAERLATTTEELSKARRIING